MRPYGLTSCSSKIITFSASSTQTWRAHVLRRDAISPKHAPILVRHFLPVNASNSFGNDQTLTRRIRDASPCPSSPSFRIVLKSVTTKMLAHKNYRGIVANRQTGPKYPKKTAIIVKGGKKPKPLTRSVEIIKERTYHGHSSLMPPLTRANEFFCSHAARSSPAASAARTGVRLRHSSQLLQEPDVRQLRRPGCGYCNPWSRRVQPIHRCRGRQRFAHRAMQPLQRTLPDQE